MLSNLWIVHLHPRWTGLRRPLEKIKRNRFNWKKEISNTRKLRVRIALTTLRVLVQTVQPLSYSETPPYGHLFNTATFCLAAWQKPPYIFSLKTKKTSLIWPIFFCPLVTVLTRFHCTVSAQSHTQGLKTSPSTVGRRGE